MKSQRSKEEVWSSMEKVNNFPRILPKGKWWEIGESNLIGDFILNATGGKSNEAKFKNSIFGYGADNRR